MAKGINKRGGRGNDVFRGTNSRDRYFGEGGNDRLFGFGGNDLCEGGIGNDLVDGGAGGDVVRGGAGNDILIGGLGDDTIDGGAGNDRIDAGAGDDQVLGGAGSDRILGGLGDDTIDGGSGNDGIDGGLGDDQLRGGSGSDRMFGGEGDDNLQGGSGNDFMFGGSGNDLVVGDTGNDRMIGGLGDDTLDWDDGDGNDVMSGNDGRDTIEVDGSVARGDNFVLGKNSAGLAFFERIGLDGQAIGQFNLTVDTAEVFDVSGEGGNDTFVINDLTATGIDLIEFEGGAGNDSLDARNTSTRVVASGGEGDDLLIGGTGTIVVGTATLGDTLTGGTGRDKFQFSTDPFAGGPIGNVNRPDVITDFALADDQLVFDRTKFGLDNLVFTKGEVNLISGNSNLIVLEGSFANAGLAANAIRDNNNITAGRGVFVYFNSTLGFSRAVFSENLAAGGRFSVQGNLTNLTSAGQQADFSASNFALA